jgi:hypothetical protein
MASAALTSPDDAGELREQWRGKKTNSKEEAGPSFVEKQD